VADDLTKPFPEDTIVQFVYLPTLRPEIVLAHINPSKAIDSLQAAIPVRIGLTVVVPLSRVCPWKGVLGRASWSW